MSTRPTIPLHALERGTIAALGPKPTDAQLIEVRRKFAARREAEFPNWRNHHNAAMKAWAEKEGF